MAYAPAAVEWEGSPVVFCEECIRERCPQCFFHFNRQLPLDSEEDEEEEEEEEEKEEDEEEREEDLEEVEEKEAIHGGSFLGGEKLSCMKFLNSIFHVIVA